MTLRRNGTERGTLKTRMRVLIRKIRPQYRGGSRIGHGRAGLSIEDYGDARVQDGVTGRRAPIKLLTRYATLSRNASSAAAMASGVPTCIQTPSRRSPNRRSCSLARSNILVSENAAFGASAKIEGEMMAAPA